MRGPTRGLTVGLWRWVCGVLTFGRHHPEVLAPVCGRCGVVVPAPPGERPVGIYTPPEGTPVVLDPFTLPPGAQSHRLAHLRQEETMERLYKLWAGTVVVLRSLPGRIAIVASVLVAVADKLAGALPADAAHDPVSLAIQAVTVASAVVAIVRSVITVPRSVRGLRTTEVTEASWRAANGGMVTYTAPEVTAIRRTG